MGAVSAIGGMMGGGDEEGGAGVAPAVTTTISNKAKGPNVKLNLGNSDTRAKGGKGGGGGVGGGGSEGGNILGELHPLVIAAAMVFLLVLVAIVALVGGR